MHNKAELDARLREMDLRPQKKWGQNFLLNPQIIQTILGRITTSEFSRVVEIGPGAGALTDSLQLVEQNFSVIEIDKKICAYWEKKSVKVLNSDALALDWNSLGDISKACLVSNLPYSIAGSLVLEMCLGPWFKTLILMFQKEVALRITAKPKTKEYGILSVMGQTFWDVKLVVDAGPQDFYPVPNVGSRALEFQRKTLAIDGKGYLKFVKAAFAQRRKKLVSNLGMITDRNLANEAILSLGHKTEARAEELTVQDFQELWRLINPPSVI